MRESEENALKWNDSHLDCPSPIHFSQLEKSFLLLHVLKLHDFVAYNNFAPSCRAVYQFNLQLHPASRDTMSRNVSFLRDTTKLDLDGHCNRIIDPSAFFQQLTESSLLSNTNIYAYFRYIVRGFENITVLPQTKDSSCSLSTNTSPECLIWRSFAWEEFVVIHQFEVWEKVAASSEWRLI